MTNPTTERLEQKDGLPSESSSATESSQNVNNPCPSEMQAKAESGSEWDQELLEPTPIHPDIEKLHQSLKKRKLSPCGSVRHEATKNVVTAEDETPANEGSSRAFDSSESSMMALLHATNIQAKQQESKVEEANNNEGSRVFDSSESSMAALLKAARNRDSQNVDAKANDSSADNEPSEVFDSSSSSMMALLKASRDSIAGPQSGLPLNEKPQQVSPEMGSLKVTGKAPVAVDLGLLNQGKGQPSTFGKSAFLAGKSQNQQLEGGVSQVQLAPEVVSASDSLVERLKSLLNSDTGGGNFGLESVNSPSEEALLVRRMLQSTRTRLVLNGVLSQLMSPPVKKPQPPVFADSNKRRKLV